MGCGSRWKTSILLVSALLELRVMCFGQDAVKLLRLKKLSHAAEALPRIAHPSPAQVKINRSFALIDQGARGLAHSCQGASEDGEEMFYSRSVDVMSKGPLFVSVDLNEEIDCGGVHAYYGNFTLTYNLLTGEMVCWAKLLTKSRAEELKVNLGNMQPIEIPGVASLLLQKLYSSGWKDYEDCTLDDVVDPSGERLTTFLLSPAPHRQGLSVLPANLASVSANCVLQSS